MIDLITLPGLVTWNWDPVLVSLSSTELFYDGLLLLIAFIVGSAAKRGRQRSERGDTGGRVTNCVITLAFCVGVYLVHRHYAGYESVLNLRYYGVLFALALAVGYITMRWRYRDEREDPEGATNLTYALMLAVVVGARLVHCLFYDFDRYMADPMQILYFWKGGLASHGAAAALILVCLLYDIRWRHTSCRITLDRLAFCVPFAMICVRLGNFFNSEIVGAPCDPDSPIAFIFTRYDMTPRYPSQLFEVGMGIIAGIVMFGMYFYYKKKNKPRPLGLSTSLILFLYFGMRFCVEFFKEYQVAENIGGLREGQILSIPFIIVSLIGIGMCLFGPWRNQNVLQYTKNYQLTDDELAAIDSGKSLEEFRKEQKIAKSKDNNKSDTNAGTQEKPSDNPDKKSPEDEISDTKSDTQEKTSDK